MNPAIPILLLALAGLFIYLEARRERHLPEVEPEPERAENRNFPPRNIGPTAETHLGKVVLPDRERRAA